MRREDSGKQRSLERREVVRSPSSSYLQSTNGWRNCQLPSGQGTLRNLLEQEELWNPVVVASHSPLLTFRAAEAANHPSHSRPSQPHPSFLIALSSSICISSPYLPLFSFPTLVTLCMFSFGTITATLPLVHSSLQGAINTPFPPSLPDLSSLSFIPLKP